jgi:hypothetical protein
MNHVQVLLLEHRRSGSWEEEDIKIVGYYTTETLARDALQAISQHRGFRDYPHGFSIHSLTVDEWRGPSVTEIAFGPDESLNDDFCGSEDPQSSLYSLFERGSIPPNRIVLRGLFSSRLAAEGAARDHIGPSSDWGVFSLVLDETEWDEGFVTDDA